VDLVVVIVGGLSSDGGVCDFPVERISMGMRPVVMIIRTDPGMRIMGVGLRMVVVGSASRRISMGYCPIERIGMGMGSVVVVVRPDARM